MRSSRGHRLVDYLSESRLLVGLPGGPLVKTLLALAETVVQGGSVRRPLEYYKELVNQAFSHPPLSEPRPIPNLRVFQVCSAEIKKLTAALALCPEGARSDQGEAIHLILLISTPLGAFSSSLTLQGQAIRLLEPRAQRALLLGSTSVTEAWTRLSQLDSDPAPTTRA